MDFTVAGRVQNRRFPFSESFAGAQLNHQAVGAGRHAQREAARLAGGGLIPFAGLDVHHRHCAVRERHIGGTSDDACDRPANGRTRDAHDRGVRVTA